MIMAFNRLAWVGACQSHQHLQGLPYWVEGAGYELAIGGLERCQGGSCLLPLGGSLEAAQVRLTWTAPTTNADGTPLTDLAGYRVYFGLASRRYGAPIDVGRTTSYALTGLAGGQRYYAAVTAYDTSGNESVYSAEVSFVAPPDAAPVANFTASPTSGTAPLTVAFTDASTGNITSWSWTFGDGGTSTTRNPTYTYRAAGTYTVSLQVSGPDGSNTATKSGYIRVSTPSSTPGLIAAYSFDEGGGTTVADRSGNGNTGTLKNGPTWTTGKYGGALSFDGLNDYVAIPNSLSLDIAGKQLTISLWVHLTDRSSPDMVLLGKPWSSAWGYPYYQYALEYDANGAKTLDFLFGDTTGTLRGPFSLKPPVGVWVHVAFTDDGAAVKGYLNGVQQFSVPETSALQARGTELRLGVDGAGGQAFQGTLDEVRLYNRALTASEIQADMTKAISSTISGASMAMTRPQVGPPLGPTTAALTPFSNSSTAFQPMTASQPSASRQTTRQSAATEALSAEDLEVGETLVDHQWKRIEFSKPFGDPVVIAKALSYREAKPAVVVVGQVDPTGFMLRLQPWDTADSGHAPEHVGYLVLERGRFTLPNGTQVESGTLPVDADDPTVALSFTQPFRTTPVVITATSDPQAASLISVRPTRIDHDGFQVVQRRRESTPGIAAVAVVSYVAWEPSSGTLGDLTFEVGRTRQIKRDRFQTIVAHDRFAEVPVFLADIQAAKHGNPLNLRWDTKDLSSVAVKIDDDPFEAAATDGSDLVGYLLIR
jgi:PKD repeat protein